MLELARTVRFCLNDPVPDQSASLETEKYNSFSSWPAMAGLGRFYQLTVACRGQADPASGYLLNIRQIDQAVRQNVLPHLQSVIASQTSPPMGALMQHVLALLQPPLHDAVQHVRLELTPYHSLQIGKHAMNQLSIRQQYEFSASHRLHVPAWSAARNQEVFGKCNNPAGHGHNYRLHVTVTGPITPDGRVLPVAQLDELVNREIIELLDHKHLNTDVPALADLNPSVENITQVIFNLLKEKLPALGVTLQEVSVSETEKTVCTIRHKD
ncbi:MAG: 6-carboxytetrahydropterin synthase [Phycisphaeraceae bacterium]|nr:6-carboxytetrahydropterin synthase [Phycisphaeraceae bacterium]